MNSLSHSTLAALFFVRVYIAGLVFGVGGVPGFADERPSRGAESSFCKSAVAQNPTTVGGETSRPPAVIFDTDMGSDCDDAGALAVLHSLVDAGELRVLGVIFSSGKNRFGVGVCDAINTYFGRGELALGQYAGSDVGDPNDSYTKSVALAVNTFHHDVIDRAPDAVKVYKQLLASEPNNSVTIVTVGHPHVLVHLMRDSEGKHLVEQKVCRWVAMGGGWNFAQCGVDAYMEELFEKWPKPLYVSLAGAEVKTGHRLLPESSADYPVRESYRLWNKSVLSTGRPSWDQLAVLFVARPELFKTSENGRHVRIAPKKPIWDSSVNNPSHFLVEPRISNTKLEKMIEELMTRSPKIGE